MYCFFISILLFITLNIINSHWINPVMYLCQFKTHTENSWVYKHFHNHSKSRYSSIKIPTIIIPYAMIQWDMNDIFWHIKFNLNTNKQQQTRTLKTQIHQNSLGDKWESITRRILRHILRQKIVFCFNYKAETGTSLQKFFWN